MREKHKKNCGPSCSMVLSGAWNLLDVVVVVLSEMFVNKRKVGSFIVTFFRSAQVFVLFDVVSKGHQNKSNRLFCNGHKFFLMFVGPSMQCLPFVPKGFISSFFFVS